MSKSKLNDKVNEAIGKLISCIVIRSIPDYDEGKIIVKSNNFHPMKGIWDPTLKAYSGNIETADAYNRRLESTIIFGNKSNSFLPSKELWEGRHYVNIICLQSDGKLVSQDIFYQLEKLLNQMGLNVSIRGYEHMQETNNPHTHVIIAFYDTWI